MLGLRDVQAVDREMIRQWRNRPDIARHMYSEHEIGPSEHEQWFDAAIVDPRRRYWIITLGVEDVGLVNLYGIDEEHSRAYWAFYLASENTRGRGVGSYVEWRVLTYVFETLGLHRLVCEVLEPNRAVVSMHEGFGFRREGHLRQHIRKSSGFVDVVQLGMLRDEWFAKREEVCTRLEAKGVL